MLIAIWKQWQFPRVQFVLFFFVKRFRKWNALCDRFSIWGTKRVCKEQTGNPKKLQLPFHSRGREGSKHGFFAFCLKEHTADLCRSPMLPFLYFHSFFPTHLIQNWKIGFIRKKLGFELSGRCLYVSCKGDNLSRVSCSQFFSQLFSAVTLWQRESTMQCSSQKEWTDRGDSKIYLPSAKIGNFQFFSDLTKKTNFSHVQHESSNF